MVKPISRLNNLRVLPGLQDLPCPLFKNAVHCIPARSGRKEDEFRFAQKNGIPKYYRSKFTVFSREDNTFGGTLITIIFPTRPDKVFIAMGLPGRAEADAEIETLELGKFTEEDSRSGIKSEIQDNVRRQSP